MPQRVAPPVTDGRRKRPAWLDGAPKVLDVVARAICLIVGAGLLVSAVVGLFADAGNLTIAILVAGGLLVLVPTVVDRLETLAMGADGVSLKLVQQVAASGAPHTAKALQKLGLGPEIDAYGRFYLELAGDAHQEIRSVVLDRIISDVAGASAVEKFDRDEVLQLFHEGTPVMRMMALGLMEGDLSLVDPQVLLEGVSRSLTGNEQFHALNLAYRAWDRLSPADRTELKAAIKRSVHLDFGPGRQTLANKVLDLPIERAPGAPR